MPEPNLKSTVVLTRAARPGYCTLPDMGFPELPDSAPVTTTLAALRDLLHTACLDLNRYDTAEWNPLGDIVGPGARVLVKPNWVRHLLPRDQGLDCLLTHSDLIDAVLIYLAKVRGCRVVVGDAPIQGCRFDQLLASGNVPEIIDRHRASFESLEVADFRKTVMEVGWASGRVRSGCRDDSLFVLFDLGSSSLLEQITTEDPRFRVTVYNPDHLARTHAPGRHQYLIAREVIDADVVINLPKLKTHKKAGVTGALKNMVGVNGHKEYLAHHRKGGSARGGDCYQGGSLLKRAAEEVLDAANRRESVASMRLAYAFVAVLCRVSTLLGGDDNLEGSWYGNDTVWRMSLDLQRIVHYGRADGTFAEEPQRQVITVTDAIVAGEGDGPLAPDPCPLGLLTMSLSTAAAELVHSFLMGFDPMKIPIVREAFHLQPWPITEFGPEDVVVKDGESSMTPYEAGLKYGMPFEPSRYWKGHIERER